MADDRRARAGGAGRVGQAESEARQLQRQAGRVLPPTPAQYAQGADPSLQHYIPAGDHIVGQRAVETQEAGNIPRAADVRVRAQPLPQTHGGQGLHEVDPTSRRAEISAIADDGTRHAAAAAQSGARTTPAVTLLRAQAAPIAGTGDRAHEARVAGHTGTFLNPDTGGSTHTRGQAAGHDALRESARDAVARRARGELSDVGFAAESALAQVNQTPTGPEVMADDRLTGARTNLRATSGSAFGPPGERGGAREAFADEIHERREAVKHRIRQFQHVEDEAGTGGPSRGRSPSPARRPLRHGGGYIEPGARQRSPSPPPALPGDRDVAHATAYMTEPMRLPRDGTGGARPQPVPAMDGGGGGAGAGPAFGARPPAAAFDPAQAAQERGRRRQRGGAREGAPSRSPSPPPAKRHRRAPPRGR